VCAQRSELVIGLFDFWLFNAPFDDFPVWLDGMDLDAYEKTGK